MKRKNGKSFFETVFGRFAIPNLSLVLILCYLAGYLIEAVNPEFMAYLRLDPYQILHGQIWRVFTWVVSPPEALNLFTFVMLLFYYSIGTNLERVWGTYRYNAYVFTGMFLTVIASFVCMGVSYALLGDYLRLGYLPAANGAITTETFFRYASCMFSTYYINMSIFLAYAATYPEHQVLLMFIIPVKVKWLGIVYVLMMLLEMYEFYLMGIFGWFAMAAVAASLINFFFFWLAGRRSRMRSPKQIKRQIVFVRQVKEGTKINRRVHKCCVCDRTSEEYPELEFRFCSKCVGDREYCQDHLFTHTHVTGEF